MTWSLSASGHPDDNSAENQKQILRTIVEGLDEADTQILSLSFSSNDVHASTLDEARALLATETE